MSNNYNSKIDPLQPTSYQIRIKGHLGRQWTEWFEGLTVTQEEDGDTLITGPVIDQAALHGSVKKVRDLGRTFDLGQSCQTRPGRLVRFEANPEVILEGSCLHRIWATGGTSS